MYLDCPEQEKRMNTVLDGSGIDSIAENVQASAIMQSELDYFRERFWKSDVLDFVQTRSEAMTTVFNKIRSVAPTRSPVLLAGETGTGKGLLAKIIHQHSNRAESQFISVHCGAIPDTLLESELYGHEKGAFTGASRRKLGRFEISNNGTIFLDEIGTITPSAQIKLLQVLQDGTYSRVGGEEVLRTNARVISATNTDLKQMTETGQFRKDLFYRLNVFPIELPPLRDRKEDILVLTDYFLKKLSVDFQKEIHAVSAEVRSAFLRYGWPGNIRELENLLERAYILESGPQLTKGSFPKELFEETTPAPNSPPDYLLPLPESRRQVIKNFEAAYLKALMSRNMGKMANSAREAGITTRQLHKLLTKYGLKKESFKEKG
jgi:transcriptional regulator with GAF, ATPase, and Fis domain